MCIDRPWKSTGPARGSHYLSPYAPKFDLSYLAALDSGSGLTNWLSSNSFADADSPPFELSTWSKRRARGVTSKR